MQKQEQVFILENLDCANCAAKMESRIRELEEVEEVSITFATKQLRLVTKASEDIQPLLQKVCKSVEAEVEVVPREKADRISQTKEKEDKLKPGRSEEKRELIEILLGLTIYLAAEVYYKLSGGEDYSLPIVIAFVLSYLILGGGILLTAGKNIIRGQIFDENFLMSIATIGAFAIGEYPEAVGVMLFFRVGEFFEHIAVEKSRSQIMSAVDLRPEMVQLVEGEEIRAIDADDAKVDDIVLVRPGDRIPLDGVVVEGESRIDTSAVTGEPVPVKVAVGSNVISGCVNTSGTLKVKVEKTLEESMVSRILNSVEHAAANKPKIDSFITRFARIYTPIVVVIALFTAIAMPLIRGEEFYPWIYTALSFLVMSCPCALVLSVPLAFFCGIGKASRKGILFKGGIVLEALASIKAVVMDKTGTITKGNFVLNKIIPENGYKEEALLSLCASCELDSTHPIAVSIVEAARERSLQINRPTQVEEIAGKGIKALLNEKVILCGNKSLLAFFGVDLSNYNANNSGAEVLVAVDGVYVGYLMIADTIKPEAKDAISRMKRENLKTVVLTGDAINNAEEITKEVGVEEVHAKLLPQDKLNKLLDIRNTYKSVMFVGDGINDAPVLAGADVGAAMGSGADAAIEAADVVFMNSNMDAIPDSIRIAKKTTKIARQNVIFALVIKIAVMILGITGIYSNMWLAVFADTGVAFICILNSIRILYGR